ncbi:TolC family protein [Gemmatimonas sp.]|uniref:TolC family protein n=1 Tax=Gemmatimonas sp. TaxID=1962908 RepID=UPI00356B2149
MYFTRHQTNIALLALGTTLAACVPPAARRGTQGVESVLATRGDTRFSGLRLDSTPPQAPRIPAGPLALDSAARLALVRSPHVRAVLADVGIAAADLWQASRLTNPTVNGNYGFRQGGGTALSGIGVGFSVISALQVPLKKRIAAAELRSAEQRVADAVYDAVLDVQRAYVAVQHAQQMVELRQNVAQVTAASAAVAKALREAGNLPALDVAAEEAMAAESVTGIASADAELALARAELGRLMGAGVSDTAWTIGPLLENPTREMWPLAMMDSLALSRRMDIASAREGAEAAAHALGLSRRFRLLPDGTIGASFERDPDGQFVGPTASVTLPLFDRGGAAVARARSALAQRVATHDALVVNAHAEVRSALAHLETAQRRALQIRTVVLPARRRVVTESQLQTNAMALPVFALLQARQMEIDAGQMYLDALRDYWFARAELERATGGPLPVPSVP